MNGVATVSVYSSFGGTLLSQGTESFNSAITLLWQGSCSVYVTATESNGRLSYAGSLSLTSNGTTTLAMTPNSGFICYTGTLCIFPLPTTLHSTFIGVSGSQVWTYGTGVWTASFSVSGVAYVLTIDPSGTMTGTWNGNSFSISFSITQCPEAFAFSGDIDGSGDPNGNLNGGGTLTE